MSDQFLIEKRGLYYRPNAQGYTGRKSEAGRYSFEEAAERVGPNGPDGPQDGLGMWREDEAPEHSSRCPWDIKMEDTFFRRGYDHAKREDSARIAALEAERDKLREALQCVETWWLEQGMRESVAWGAPYAMFAARAALAETEGE